MVRRLFLVGLALLVAVPAFVLVLEHARGARQLADTLAELQARGEILDLSRLVPPAAPAGSNGLATLIAATDPLKDPSQLFPPPFIIVAPGRAVSTLTLDSWSGDRRSTNTWADVERWTAEHAADLDLLRAALELPLRRPTLDWQMGSKMTLPHLARYKSAIVALSISASEMARRGDLEAAANELHNLTVLEKDLETDPLLIGHLVRVACSSIANSRLWSIAQARDWTEPQLARLQQALPTSNLAAGMVRGLEGERAMVLLELRRLSPSDLAELQNNLSIFGPGSPTPGLQAPETFDQAVDLAKGLTENLARGIGAKVILPLWHYGWGDQAVTHYLQCLDRLLLVQRDAVRHHSLAEARSLDLSAFYDPPTLTGKLRRNFAAMLVPALERGVANALRTDTERDLHLTGIALQRFRLRHGRLPASLDELVPDFLPGIPVDTMDGHPLRYRRDSDDTFTLWSIGEDLQDNGGDPTSTTSQASSFQWWRARDAVWPQRATTEQIEAWRAAEAARPEGKPVSTLLNAELMKRYGLVPRTNAGTTNPVFEMSNELRKRYGLAPATPAATSAPVANPVPP